MSSDCTINNFKVYFVPNNAHRSSNEELDGDQEKRSFPKRGSRESLGSGLHSVRAADALEGPGQQQVINYVSTLISNNASPWLGSPAHNVITHSGQGGMGAVSVFPSPQGKTPAAQDCSSKRVNLVEDMCPSCQKTLDVVLKIMQEVQQLKEQVAQLTAKVESLQP